MGSVLVTGGAGYIGSHVALALLERGENVVILDDLSMGKPASSLPGALFVQGSVEDKALVANLIKEHDIDAVIHLAGFIKVEESVREPEKYFKNNTENTKILLDTALENGVKYFIFSSTASVYGNPKTLPVGEDEPTDPINPYAESKLEAERIIESKSVAHPFGYVILRYFNVAGSDPKQRVGYRIEEHPTHLIRRAIRTALQGTELTIFGSDYPTSDGTAVRDYLHVSDLAEAHCEALEYLRRGDQSRIFNYGYGRGYSVAEVVEAVGRVADKEIKVVYGERRAGDPASIVADASRIKRELKLKPKHDDLDTIIADEIAWVRLQKS